MNVPIPDTETYDRVKQITPGFDPERRCFVAPDEVPADMPVTRQPDGVTWMRGHLIVVGFIDCPNPFQMSPRLAEIVASKCP